MPESLEEIAHCQLYEPTAQREAVLARTALDHEARLAALEALLEEYKRDRP